MDDLISRKALLAEYDRVHIGEPGKARKLIEDAPAVQQWISVKDRLPEDEKKVLCILDDGFLCILEWCSWDWLWNDGHNVYAEKDVTHWMPLPQPPANEIKCHKCNGTDEPEHYQNKKYCPNCGARVDA